MEAVEKLVSFTEKLLELSKKVDELLKTNEMLLTKLEERFKSLEVKEKQVNVAVSKAMATSAMLDAMYEMKLEDLKLTVRRREAWHEAIREDE